MIDFERYSVPFGESKLKDFRDNLFSIFVDNLSSNVDQRCLWEVFKPFGKVRDVYLSMEKRSRRSKFAFVRFETLKEAVVIGNNRCKGHVITIKNHVSRSQEKSTRKGRNPPEVIYSGKIKATRLQMKRTSSGSKACSGILGI